MLLLDSQAESRQCQPYVSSRFCLENQQITELRLVLMKSLTIFSRKSRDKRTGCGQKRGQKMITRCGTSLQCHVSERVYNVFKSRSSTFARRLLPLPLTGQKSLLSLHSSVSIVTQIGVGWQRTLEFQPGRETHSLDAGEALCRCKVAGTWSRSLTFIYFFYTFEFFSLLNKLC
jgi:hypothetical protein